MGSAENSTISMSTNAINDEVILPIVPIPTGALVSDELVVTVSTDNPTGYTLKMHSLTDNTDLVNVLDPNQPNTSINPSSPLVPTLPVIASTSASVESPAALTPNTWGYTLDAPLPTTPTFSAIPGFSTPEIIKQTEEPSVNSTTTITFAANASNALPAGIYTGTIVFTATSNYVLPPDNNWAANDSAATITAFDEYGVLTSTMAGLIPIDYTNSTTYSNTTTQGVGLANFNIIKGYLNNNQQIDVDDEYYLEVTTTNAQILTNLTANDSVRIRGVGDKNKFLFKPRNWNDALFEFNVGIDLYVQNVDFEIIKTVVAPKDLLLFRYRIPTNYSTTAFLMDEIIIRDCSFEGAMRILEINATPPTGYGSERTGPSKHVVDKLIIHNNKFVDVTSPYIFDISDPYIKEFRITNNDLRNTGWVFVSFLNDNTSNDSVDGSTAHNLPNRPSIFYIDSNKHVNSDSFDIHLAWKDVRESASNPWGPDRTSWSTRMYFSSIVHKGSTDITFSNNHIEGLNSWGVSNSTNVYDVYLSGHRVLYENNVLKNIMAFYPNKGNYDLVKAKHLFSPAADFASSNRTVRNNKFIIDDDYHERILKTNLNNYSDVDILNMLRVGIMYMQDPLHTFIFEKNTIEVPVLELYANNDYGKVDVLFNNNNITVGILRGYNSNAFASFLTLSTATATPGNTWELPPSITHLTRTMIGNTINVKNINNIDVVVPPSVRNRVAVVVGVSHLQSTITVEDNIFNMANLDFIFADRNNANGSHGTTNIPNMTLKFNNNSISTKPPGDINKKDVASAGTIVFNQFNGNTTNPSFNFIGSN